MLEQITNQLNQEITLTHTPTCFWLLKKSPDAFCLYNFYCYTASWQGYNPVKANTEYVMAGLKWGENRLFKAKKILKEGNIIKDIVRRDDQGKVLGNYILVRYINKNDVLVSEKDRNINEKTNPQQELDGSINISSTTLVDQALGFTSTGPQRTNTDKDNINTNKDNKIHCHFPENDPAQQNPLFENSIVRSEGTSEKVEQPEISPTEAYNKFVERFNEVFQRKHRASQDMIKKMQTRLKNYSLDEIMTALERLGEWDFAHGENDRGWRATPDFLLRNDSQVDRFLNQAPKAEQQKFKDPDQILSAEIRVMACLETGVWDDGVNAIYTYEFIPWMRKENKEINFETGVDYLVQFIHRQDPPQKVNSLSWIMVLQTYEKYLRTCTYHKLQPNTKIVELGERVKNEHGSN